jgi:hypothetical protein
MIYAAMAVGAFYVFAGFVVMRAMVLDRLMDQMLVALNDPGSAKERLRSKVLSVGAILTMAGGAALAILSPLAAVLFVANALWQGGYLLWAERALPPEDEADKRGRQQTKNAFVIYLAATAFVLWLAGQGNLRPWDAPLTSHALDAAVMAAVVAASWWFIRLPRRSREDGATGEAADATVSGDERLPVRLRLAPEWNCSPLWDADTGAPVSVYRLGLSFELSDRIEAWDDTWQATYNDDDPAAGGFKDETAQQAYLAEGRAIVEALRGEWSGELEVDQELR